jgi:hypothetical protein
MTAPHTEADPVAMLVQLLAYAGAVIGPEVYFQVGAEKHPPRIFLVLVGGTSSGRKGTALSEVRRVFAEAFRHQMIQQASGLSSGEGLIWCVRDPIYKSNKSGKRVLEDPGVQDKRVVVRQTEFAQVLKVATRDGNTLSVVIRDAWDRGDLQTMTKNTPANATGAHIIIVGHITPDELRRELLTVDAANGFGNRFLWCCSRRSQYLPDGGTLQDAEVKPRAEELHRVICNARSLKGAWKRDAGASELWHSVYPGLTEDRPGMFGNLVSRAEAQVVRLSFLYALLDAEPQTDRLIRAVHLKAALEVWRYCEESACHIFGDSLGDPKADQALAILRAAGPYGLSRTELATALFGKHHTRERIGRVIRVLVDQGLIVRAEPQGNGPGRSPERWVAVEFHGDHEGGYGGKGG